MWNHTPKKIFKFLKLKKYGSWESKHAAWEQHGFDFLQKFSSVRKNMKDSEKHYNKNSYVLDPQYTIYKRSELREKSSNMNW